MTMRQIKRQQVLEDIQFAFKVTPVCGLIGPRQCGKTTTAKEIANHYPGTVHHFDLEDERDQNKMREPLMALPPVPQAPQLSKKDMMRALGMGGFGSFFSGGNLPNVGFHSHAMPAAPGLSFHIATSLQNPGFVMGTWHRGAVGTGGIGGSVAPTFTQVDRAAILENYRKVCGGFAPAVAIPVMALVAASILAKEAADGTIKALNARHR